MGFASSYSGLAASAGDPCMLLAGLGCMLHHARTAFHSYNGGANGLYTSQSRPSLVSLALQ